MSEHREVPNVIATCSRITPLPMPSFPSSIVVVVCCPRRLPTLSSYLVVCYRCRLPTASTPTLVFAYFFYPVISCQSRPCPVLFQRDMFQHREVLNVVVLASAVVLTPRCRCLLLAIVVFYPPSLSSTRRRCLLPTLSPTAVVSYPHHFLTSSSATPSPLCCLLIIILSCRCLTRASPTSTNLVSCSHRSYKSYT
jgi:hypothetical protein